MSTTSPFAGKWRYWPQFGSALPICAMVIGLVILISSPLPSLELDVLVALNLVAGVLLLLSVLYIRSIVEFSTFAILLLITTIFRLATSVSTTRAILSGGDPGDAIRTFGKLVVGGSVTVGLVVFLIIAIVQFIVITKGAERIAEVAARFNLDAMPGRQMSIEADIRAGAITQEEAGRLRETLRAESQIIGSLDGSMKFVKGDSIASFVIVFVNLLGGLAVGVGVLGMSFADAGRLFSILTIGDGLVAQIPSILSAIAAGLFVTRAGSESRQNVVSLASSELSANRTIFAIVAGLLLIGGVVPGMPIYVFWGMATAIFGSLAWAHHGAAPAVTEGTPPPNSKPLELGKHSDPYLCLLSPETLKRLDAENFSAILTDATRRQVKQAGIGLPLLLFEADIQIPPKKLRLVFEGVTEADVNLAESDDLGRVAEKITALLVKRFIENFGAQDTDYYLQQIEATYPYIKDLVQAWPQGLLGHIFRRMLMDGISIAHPRPIVQSIDESLREGLIEEDQIYAKLRLALKERIVSSIAGDNRQILVKKLPEQLVSLASRAAPHAEDLSGLIDKEDAFSELTKEISNLASSMAETHFVVPDEIRATCVEAAWKANVGCIFLGAAEIENVRRANITFH